MKKNCLADFYFTKEINYMAKVSCDVSEATQNIFWYAYALKTSLLSEVHSLPLFYSFTVIISYNRWSCMTHTSVWCM